MKLTKLPTFDFNQVYAEDLGNNKVNHYTLSIPYCVTKNRPVDELLKEALSARLNIDPNTIEISYLPNITKIISEPAPMVLENHPKIRKELEKVKCDSFIYQYTEILPGVRFYHRIIRWVSEKINYVITQLNYRLASIQRMFNKVEDEDLLTQVNYRPFLLPTLPLKSTYVRKCVPCSYLSVAFTDDQAEDAAMCLFGDLKTLSDQGLIMGHMSMPEMMILSDTVGNGKKNFVLYCFVFVNLEKVCKITDKDYSKMANLPLKNFLGIITEGYEGSIGFDMREPIEINTVDLSENFIDEGYEEYVKNWEERQKLLRKVK